MHVQMSFYELVSHTSAVSNFWQSCERRAFDTCFLNGVQHWFCSSCSLQHPLVAYQDAIWQSLIKMLILFNKRQVINCNYVSSERWQRARVWGKLAEKRVVSLIKKLPHLPPPQTHILNLNHETWLMFDLNDFLKNNFKRMRWNLFSWDHHRLWDNQKKWRWMNEIISVCLFIWHFTQRTPTLWSSNVNIIKSPDWGAFDVKAWLSWSGWFVKML